MIFIYNFITFGVGACVPFQYSSVFLPIDMSISAILLTALVFQIPFTPKLPKQCSHFSSTLANGYFLALAKADLKDWKPGKDDEGNPLPPPSGVSECKDFYTIWALEITVVWVLYIIYLWNFVNVG